MINNPSLWDLPDAIPYRLSELANRSQCHRCKSAIWHLISRAGFEIKLDPERITRQMAVEMGAREKTLMFPTMATNGSFVANFLRSTDNPKDMADADFENKVYLALHKCNLDNIRTDVIDHWKGKR